MVRPAVISGAALVLLLLLAPAGRGETAPALSVAGPAAVREGGEYVLRVRLEQPGRTRWDLRLDVTDRSGRGAGEPSSFAAAAQGADAPVEWLVRWSAPRGAAGAVTFRVSAGSGDALESATAASATAGVLDAADTLLFLSFPPESLITKRPVKRDPASSLWGTVFTNTTGGEVSRLEARFNGSVTLTRFLPFPEAMTTDGGETWVISGQTIVNGDQLRVEGTGPRNGTEVRWWRFGEGALQAGFTPGGQLYVPSLPNNANVRAETFRFGGFAPGRSESDPVGGMVLGRSSLRYRNFRWRVDADSARLYGWVRLRTQSAVQRSLAYGSSQRRHRGDPRGFCSFDNGKPFTHQNYLLPPVRMDNRLVAGLIALKMNIAASQLGITPPGFGELEYVDPGHPLDGLLVREISDVTDTLMTRCRGTAPGRYWAVDSVLAKINAAFAGGIDTVSFSNLLVLKGVRPLREVPFLRPTTRTDVVRLDRRYYSEFDENEAEEAEDPGGVPEVVLVAENYPNPFNPSTTIRFELHEASLVTVSVYDLLGRQVARLVEGDLLVEGTNEAEFRAEGLASGVYFYRLTAEAVEDPGRLSTVVGKMVLVR